MRESPNFDPYRRGLTAADGADLTLLPFRGGVDAKGWDRAAVNFRLAGTNPTATVEVLFWSPQLAGGAGGWLRPEPAVQFAISGDASVSFQPFGRRFFLRVTAIAGVGATLDMEVAGHGPREEFA